MKNFLTNFKYLLIGLGLAITAGTALAIQVGVPQATQKGDIPTGLTSGNYQVLHPGSDGLVLTASSTSANGVAWQTASSTGGSGITSLNGLVGASQTFATGTPPTGLDLFITSSGSTHTFVNALQDGYTIPTSTLINNLNVFYTTPSNRITAGTNLSWSGNTLNDVMASSTLIAGGTATFSPSVTYATTTDTNILLNIVCGVSTCTFNPGWSGTLADGRIASAATWNAKLSTVTADSPLAGSGTSGSHLTCASCVTLVTGSGSINSSGGTTPAISLANLTSNDILFGQGNGIIATSTSLTWDGTKFSTTNASTTNLSVSNNLYTSIATGNCLQTGAGGLITGTGSACGSGGGGSLSGGTTGYVATWASSTALTKGTLIDNGSVAGQNATSSTVSFNLQSGAGLTPLVVASSTGTALLTVAGNGSTTLSSLGTGIVRANSGSLFIDPNTYLTSISLTGGATISGSSFTFASGSPDTTWNILCATATCTFNHPNNLLQGSFPITAALGGTGTTTVPTQQGQVLIADGTGAKYQPGIWVNSSTYTFTTSTIGQISGSVLKVPNALTFNNGGAGAASGQTFDGSAAATISYNTVGAQVAGTYLGNTNVSGTNGQMAYFTGNNTVNSDAQMLFNGTVFGYNATSSTIGFNIQGTQGTNDIFNVASSSGISILVVEPNQRVGIGTSTPQATLAVQGTSTYPTLNVFNVASSTGAGLFTVAANGNVGIGSSVPSSLFTVDSGTAVGTASTTMIYPQKFQIDTYNAAGTEVCAMISGTSWSIVTGACTR